MTLPDGRPKGAALVLEERGYNTKGMKLEEMRAILADYDDFKNEKCRVDTFLCNSGHTCVFIPKFQCDRESMVPEQAIHDYTIGSLRRKGKYVRQCRNYMFAYLEGSAVGQELEEKIKFYKSVTYTSHRLNIILKWVRSCMFCSCTSRR